MLGDRTSRALVSGHPHIPPICWWGLSDFAWCGSPSGVDALHKPHMNGGLHVMTFRCFTQCSLVGKVGLHLRLYEKTLALDHKYAQECFKYAQEYVMALFGMYCLFINQRTNFKFLTILHYIKNVIVGQRHTCCFDRDLYQSPKPQLTTLPIYQYS